MATNDGNYRVPDDIGIDQAFTALCKKARVLGMGVYAPNSGKAPTSSVNAMQMLAALCPGGFCEYVRGLYVKVNFSNFPELDLGPFNKEYGESAGQVAIESAASTDYSTTERYKIMPGRCEFFMPEHLNVVPYGDWYDMQEHAEECEVMQQSVNGFWHNLHQQGWDRYRDGECRVDLKTCSGQGSFMRYENMTLDEALDLLQRFENKPPNDRTIKSLHVRCADSSYGIRKSSFQAPVLLLYDAQLILHAIAIINLKIRR